VQFRELVIGFIPLRKTIPKPILGMVNDFAGSMAQFNLRLAGALCSLRSGCCRARQPPDLPFNMHRHRTAVCKRSALRPEQAFCYRSLEPAFRIQGVVSIIPRNSACPHWIQLLARSQARPCAKPLQFSRNWLRVGRVYALLCRLQDVIA